MQHRRLRFGRGFRVLFDRRGVQAAQMVIAPCVRAALEEVSELDTTERGLGGFGSTGTR